MVKNNKKQPKFREFLAFFKKYWKRFLVAGVVISIAFAIYTKVSAEPSGITSYTVEKGNLVLGFTANGTVKAKNKVDLKFYTPGKVSWVGVKAGDSVKKWQAVASLNRISLNASYQQSLNNLRNYQASVDYTLDTLQGHDTDESFSQIAERTTAQVNRDNAYLATTTAKDALTNASLISPIDGTVLSVHDLASGVNLTGADLESKFIRIADMNTLYFEAKVDEVDYSKVLVGQEVETYLDAFPDDVCEGKVREISRDGQNTAGGVITIPVEVEFVNCDLQLALGLNGQARFALEKKDDTLIAPKKYLVSRNGADYVWKKTGEETKDRELVLVKLGKSNSTETEIIEGISEGDIIIFIPEN